MMRTYSTHMYLVTHKHIYQMAPIGHDLRVIPIQIPLFMTILLTIAEYILFLLMCLLIHLILSIGIIDMRVQAGSHQLITANETTIYSLVTVHKHKALFLLPPIQSIRHFQAQGAQLFTTRGMHQLPLHQECLMVDIYQISNSIGLLMILLTAYGMIMCQIIAQIAPINWLENTTDQLPQYQAQIQ